MNNKTQNLGGNDVRSIDVSRSGPHQFADLAYRYFLHVTDGKTSFSVPDLQSYSVFVLALPPGARVVIAESGDQLELGDAIQIESSPMHLEISAADVRLLVAGTRSASGRAPGVALVRNGDIYKVSKPWGHELWINGQHPGYAFKEIAINKGTKTSLQYHRQKQETNVLFSGNARLYFKSNPAVANDGVTAGDLGQVDLAAVSSIDVVPQVIHRLEALSQVLLYEVSTPHLDDVVRIQDDAKRPDGRVASEHGR
jgi:mannose-6-phosphate isomerase